MKTRIVFLIFFTRLLAGCQNDYYTEKDFQSVLKIDSHVHLNSDKGYLEDQAIKDNFVLITLGVDHSDSVSVRKQLDFALLSAKKYPGKVFYAATFFFDTAGWGNENWSSKVISHLKNDISGGAISVKLWKNIGMTVTDRSTAHLGEPRNCWLPLSEMTVKSDSSYFARNPQYHMFLHPEFPSYEDQINARDHLLELHPDLRFIGCHLGSLEWNVDELAKRLDRFPNMVVDLAARICHLQYQSAVDRDRIRNFCIKYQDRLLYGTDLSENETNNRDRLSKEVHETWFDDWKYFTSKDEMTSDKFKGKFTGLQLPKEVVDKIFSKNAITWYKLNLK
jgi:hypothetical protein